MNSGEFSTIIIRGISRRLPEGWKSTGYGYFQMEKVISDKKKALDIKAHKLPDDFIKDESYIEHQFFRNIIRATPQGPINLFELGAGRGDWCLALAGIIDFKLIETPITEYRCLAVEAEPTHFEWMKTHFETQNIKAIPIHGAISSADGGCKFLSLGDPASDYGQSVRPDGNLTVPGYTIDTLFNKYNFDKIDILHADVQGAEYDMLLGATEVLRDKKINYMMIGTHKTDMNSLIISLLNDFGFEPLFSAKCHSGINDTPFGRANFPVDGLLVLKNKDFKP